MMKRHPHLALSAGLIVALLGSAPVAWSQHTGHDTAAPPAAPTATSGTAAVLPWVDAEVRRVDAATGKLTLRHADVPNLDMPGMTMAFAVADRQWLAVLKPGDRIQVTVDKVQGQYTVTGLRRP